MRIFNDYFYLKNYLNFMSNNVLSFVIKKSLKSLNVGSYSRNGRNSYGRICVFHRGGGNTRKYRLVDFFRR